MPRTNVNHGRVGSLVAFRILLLEIHLEFLPGLLLVLLLVASGCATKIKKTPDSDQALVSNLAHSLGEKSVLTKHEATWIEILPSGESALNHLAKTLAEQSGVKLVFDLKYIKANPHGTASFDRENATLYLPKSVMETANADDPTLQHELIHVDFWTDLKNRKPSPYYGFLEGESLKPGRLDLDEMKAYDHDVSFALDSLKKYIESTADSRQVIAGSRVREIMEARISGEHPLEHLNAFESRWDGLIKKVVHAHWHTDPVIEYVPAFLKDLSQETGAVQPVVTEKFGVPLASIKNENKNATLSMFLVASQGLTDRNNRQFLNEQADWILRTAREHEVRLEGLDRAMRAVSLAVNPDEQLAAIVNLTQEKNELNP
jgi:hypothetical protein